MNNSIYGLILTLIVGLAFVFGYFLTKIFKDKSKLINTTMGLAVTILGGIIVFDLLPEVNELFSSVKFKYPLILFFIIFGISALFILDKKIPHHDEHNNKDDHNHLYHIGLITTISLILHNFVEGSAIYSVTLSNLSGGILMTLGVLLHNIPLGMITISSIKVSKNKYRYIYLVLLVLSSFLGGLTLFILKDNISNFVLGSLIAITLGMSIYIVFFELIKEIIENKNKKESFIGIIIGIILIIISLLI